MVMARSTSSSAMLRLVTLLATRGVVAFVARAPRRAHTSPLHAQPLTVYSTAGCPHCVRAKRALDAALLAYETVDVGDPAAREALEAKSGVTSVPQVYFGDLRVGGADDVVAALADGTLAALDVAAAAPAAAPAPPADAVDVAALSEPGRPLNVLTAAAAEAWADDGDARDVAAALQRQALALVDAHVTEGGVDYGALRTSSVFAAFVATAARLRAAAESELGGDAGLVNLYNALVLHGTALLGPPEDTPAARGAFFSGATGATYEVCGAELSLDDLEHALLRRGGAPGDARAFAAGDPRRATFAATLARPFDPRIHFALNCGARSCPPVKLFREATLDGDLAAAARAFVASETSVSGATVTTSKLLLWYGADFADDDAGVVARLAAYVAGSPLGDALAALDAPELAFLDYDWDSNDAAPT